MAGQGRFLGGWGSIGRLRFGPGCHTSATPRSQEVPTGACAPPGALRSPAGGARRRASP
jgi:hypothetical protein